MLTTDVLVVGAGPIGLLTAMLLGKTGINCIVVERRATLHTAPQAHVISSRSLEICRSIGLGDAAIRQAGPNPKDTLKVRWVDRLVGRDLGVYSMVRDTDDLQRTLANSPTPPTNLSQDLFEQQLFEHLSNSYSDHTDVLFEHHWQGFEPTENGYISTLIDADHRPLEIESCYIIGADGAGSPVRKAIGADMVGPDNFQTFVNIHFSADLRTHLQGREALLYWVMDHDYAGTFIAHDIDHTWVFMKTVDADENTDPIDETKFAELLRNAIGADVELTIHSMNSWRMTAQISNLYQSGRVFLVGDAAHRFPPTGGIGMNTGFQDAHNLVWKIALVERGFDPNLLESYGVERKPIAEINSAQSLTNALKMSDVARLLDFDGDHKITLEDLDHVLADPDQGRAVQDAIDQQTDHFNMSGLDLGVCYTSAAVHSDGPPPESAHPVSQYLPSTTPGARMHHAWLTSAQGQLSTLDLVTYGRFLVLCIGPVQDITATIEQLINAGYPIDCVVIGEKGDYLAADPTFETLFSEGVLLVRPDGHIAARFKSTNPAAELGGTLLGLFPHGELMM